MKKIFYLLFSILLLSFTACEEDEDLPEPTQTGANMMAAKINGKPWQKKACWGCIGGGGGLEVDYYQGNLYIRGQQRDDQHKALIELKIEGIDINGKSDYVLKDYTFSSGIYGTNGSFAKLIDSKERDNSKVYETTAISTGKVTITKHDTENKIVSGTFSFRAQREPDEEGTAAEYVEVTEGWFDVKY